MSGYDFELTLIRENESGIGDGAGGIIPTESPTTILCKKKSSGRNEFYAAAAHGLKPEIIFVVHGYEYNGEKIVEFEGDRYSVIRTYSVDFEEVELVCSGVVGS